MLASNLHSLFAAATALPPAAAEGGSGTILESLLAADPSARSLAPRDLAQMLGGVYAGGEAPLRTNLRRLSSMFARFLELYGDGPAEILRAPARINILGEYVDYISYLPT